jgi:hypothetical protein
MDGDTRSSSLGAPLDNGLWNGPLGAAMRPISFLRTRSIITNGLTLYLDAFDSRSYSGGSTWFDLSGNNFHFTINPLAFSRAGDIPHMNFNGSAGAAKRVVGGANVDVPNAINGTIMVFTSILNSTADWRTLTRGVSGDHQGMIQQGSNVLGMYDNNSNQFVSAGFDITSLPNPYTQFNCLTIRLSQNSPFYQFQYNNDQRIFSITNANATFNNGFGMIGAGPSGNNADPNSTVQFWGRISVFIYYQRHLLQEEIAQNFNALRSRYGI